MFPHYSSSHEISTETNAFVQNSKEDVVVLEGISLSGVGDEGVGPEDAGYCDIEFINSSGDSFNNVTTNTMMVASKATISHPNANAANDFSTVLLRQFGKLDSVDTCSSMTQRSPNELSSESSAGTIFSINNTNVENKTSTLTSNNVKNINEDDNVDGGRVIDQKECQNATSYKTIDAVNEIIRKNINNSSRGHEAAAALNAAVIAAAKDQRLNEQWRKPVANSKSTFKPLSDNKNSFSSVSPRVLSLSTIEAAEARRGRIVQGAVVSKNNEQRLGLSRCSSPSLDRIPKSDDGQRAHNLKAKIISQVSLIFKPINSKSVISLGSSSTIYNKRNNSNCYDIGDYQHHDKYYNIFGGIVDYAEQDDDVGIYAYCYHRFTDKEQEVEGLIKECQASSSITLKVSTTRRANSTCLFLVHVLNDDNSDDRESCVDAIKAELERRLISALCVPLKVDFKAPISLTQRLTSAIYGISCTEATMFTVGAPSSRVYNNFKSNNEPLIISFKGDASNQCVAANNDYDYCNDHANYYLILKMISKSTPSVKYNIRFNNFSDKSDDNFNNNNADYDNDEYDDNAEVQIEKEKIVDGLTSGDYIVADCQAIDHDYIYENNFSPYKANNDIPNTCEPTMTLNCQATVTRASTTNDVPADAQPPLSKDKNDVSMTYDMDDEKARSSLAAEDCKNLLGVQMQPTIKRLREVLNTPIVTKSRYDLYNTTLPTYYRSESCSATLIQDYKQRWGIPLYAGLCGGGESSLNSNATSTGWGTTQPSTPTNNNPTQSGWNAGNTGGNGSAPPTSQQQQQQAAQGNWQQQSAQGNNTSQGPQSSAQTNNQTTQNQGGSANPQWAQQQQSSQQQQQSGNKSANQQTQNNNGSGVQPGQQQQQQPSNQQQQQQQQSQQSAQQQQQQQPGSNNNQQITNPGSVSSASTPTSNNPSTKQQLEQLNTMREALFSPDGWGCQNVNQDTHWDVPTSPEPTITKEGPPVWKPPVNNGTDLWEANIRNGGQPTQVTQTKTPWGHTPSTNIGGTWGEDDDAADTSNMWTGAPPAQAPSQPSPINISNIQWSGSSGNAGASASQTASNWGDPRVDPRDPREIRSVDPRDMRDPRDHRMSLDPREQHMRVMDPMARDPRMSGEIRGDPRGGISGRLNGASADAMWNQPPGPPHHQLGGHQHPSGPPNKMIAPSSINQWPKDMMPGKPTGWEEPSPPTQRRNMPNYDDGTSLWANPSANQRAMQGGKVSHWKDVPTQGIGRGGDYFGSGGMQCPPGMMQNQMPGQPGMKPDTGGPMWGGNHPGSAGGPAGGGHNGSWTDNQPDISGWGDNGKSRQRNYRDIIDPRIGKNPGGWDDHQKPQPMGGPTGNWGVDPDMDPTSSWGHAAKPALTKEIIWNSREFRNLCDMGYKKEDVEVALRTREMNRDEALELLSQLRPTDQWRRHDAGHSGYDPTSQSAASQSFSRFNHVNQQMSFPPGVGVPSGAVAATGGSVASAGLLKLQQQQQQQQQQAAAAVQLQQQQQQPANNAPQPPFNQASRTPQNQPSTQQLRMLVQQIQLAVQEGYLNHQILNQPLAPQTLILLNQLLQQIKVLQQLHQQHSMQNSLKGNSQTVLQLSVQITKTKQQIANLQNQIAVQQATYMKQQQQQQQQQQHPSTPSQPSDYYKPSVHDPMSALQNSFSDLTMNKEAPVSQQQSRLNQWKLPSLDKDTDSVVNEFSRAPGSTSTKPPTAPGGLSQSHSSPNMNPLLGPSDGAWSSRIGDSGWPDAGNSDATDGKDWQPGGAAFTDLVPEFEPGKPWKMKTIEDDPSLTPGSVVRSPLSLAAIKDPDTIFSAGTKTSPPPQPINPDTNSIPSLSNSTWSFNPPATTPSVFASTKNTWGDTAPPPTAVTSELWGAPMNNKSRGPPPGLGNKGSASVANASNGWAALVRTNTWGLQSNSPAASNPGGWVSPSTWLLLRNLTPQIDGSTLKTLCVQHGPVQDFRLYLNHGIALAKYSSRDESIKAQGALNNCVLGNTTILAESPLESEVHTILQQLSHGGGGGAGGASNQQPPGGSGPSTAGWGGLRPSANTKGGGGPPSSSDTWAAASGASQLWGAPPAANSLWGSSGLDAGDQQRATPSSLNSYLPGDLLGGESM